MRQKITNENIGLEVEVFRDVNRKWRLLLICMQSGAALMATKSFDSEREALIQANFALRNDQ